MSTKNNSRASELGEILTTGSTGFTVRKRTGIGLVFHLFMMASLIMLGASLLVYYRSPEGCLLAVAIGASLAIIAHNLERLKKTKEALEFMNALFSSALGKGYKCCFIVKNNGNIVFYNRPFQVLFPNYVAQDDRTLDALMTLSHISPEERGNFSAMVSTSNSGTVTATIRDNEGDEGTKLTFEIEPIERPTGFFLIRGK